MSLKNKLLYRSSLLFFFTMSFVIIGSYLLFQRSTENSYKNKLRTIAELSGHFYLEKDELNTVTHKRIEQEFQKISNESVRLYKANSKSIYVDDSLTFTFSDQIFARTKKDGSLHFKRGKREFLSLFYQDNEGDFIIIVSGEDLDGAKQLDLLKKMLLFFGIMGLILHYVLTKLLAKRTFLPFTNLVSQVNSIKGNDWNARLDYPSKKNDEIKSLVNEFNYLLERIESSIMIQRNFLKNASHEIKTPLAIIIGDIEVALNNPRSNEEYRDLLYSLKNEGLHLKSLIEGLIALSNVEITSNKLIQEIRIDEVIWNILDKKKIEYPMRKVIPDFKDSVNNREELLIVKGNKDLLFIAISNIVDNALKFSGESPVKISIDIKDNQLCISIYDRGCGIPENETETIFELFYRSASTESIPGHGIGLYLTKQILTLYHIGITVVSEPAAGTTFSLFFPGAGTTEDKD